MGQPKAGAVLNPALLVLPAVLATVGLTIAVTSDGDAYVDQVIDGDTVVLGDGSKVRLIGIDAPEAGEPCSQPATEALRRMVEKRVVTLGNPESVREQDKYGRLLRYIGADVDPASSLLTDGLAAARYDSTDGYDPHPRQDWYQLLDAAALAACPTLDRNPPRSDDPDVYRMNVEDRRLRREQAEREGGVRRHERDRREGTKPEVDRNGFTRDPGQPARIGDSEYRQPDNGYTGPRCYAPGGETWTPC